ncbi:MAG: CRISPR-associated endonuclease Cas1 [Candidatus Micrarchaeota archaeon]
MDLVINQDGYFLGKRHNRFYVRYRTEENGTPSEHEDEFSADNVRSILLHPRGSLSVGAIELANEHYIDMAILGRRNRPIARIYPCSLTGAHLVRRQQLEAFADGRGLGISRALESRKLRHQAALLKSLQKTREDVDFAGPISEILFLSEKLDSGHALDANQIMGFEGRGAALYFASLGQIIPLQTRDPDSSEPANILLNYGYGVLYHEVERACLLTGLDPYLGFLHADRPGKPSLALDLMEPFRPVIADRAVATLFAQKQVEENWFESVEGEKPLALSQKGRQKILEQVLGRMNTEYTFKGVKRSWQNWILETARSVARSLRGEKFEPVLWSGG